MQVNQNKNKIKPININHNKNEKYEPKNRDEVPRPNNSCRAEIRNLTSYLINDCSCLRSLTKWGKTKSKYVTLS